MSMCTPCREAGKLTTEAKRGLFTSASLVAAMHEQCNYPTSCTCQHSATPNALNEGQPT